MNNSKQIELLKSIIADKDAIINRLINEITKEPETELQTLQATQENQIKPAHKLPGITEIFNFCTETPGARLSKDLHLKYSTDYPNIKIKQKKLIDLLKAEAINKGYKATQYICKEAKQYKIYFTQL